MSTPCKHTTHTVKSYEMRLHYYSSDTVHRRLIHHSMSSSRSIAKNDRNIHCFALLPLLSQSQVNESGIGKTCQLGFSIVFALLKINLCLPYFLW